MWKVLLLLLSIWGSSAIRLVSYEIPSVVDFRQELVLSCDFDTEGEYYQFVRWLVNGTEFYRFEPFAKPEKSTRYVDGISVEVHKSNSNTVTLGPLYFTTSGEFTCEAQTDRYKTLAITKSVTVIALPKGGPTIEGINPRHTWGDELKLNCTSPPSYPPAEITWTVAGGPVDENLIETYSNGDENDAFNIQSTKSGIKLQSDRLPFDQTGEVTVTCITSVPGIYKNAVSLRIQKAVRV